MLNVKYLDFHHALQIAMRHGGDEENVQKGRSAPKSSWERKRRRELRLFLIAGQSQLKAPPV